MAKPRDPPLPPANGDRTDEDAVRATLAYRTLREFIVDGRMAPGTRIAEVEVAERLGMSRTPVRSALQHLRQEGFVMVSGEGRLRRTLVAPLTREDARELFDIVAALEGIAAREAASLGVAARRAIVAKMRRLTTDLRAISRSRAPDPNLRFQNDTEFHSCYMDVVAGTRLRALHDSIKPQAERYIRVYVSLLVGTSVGEHDAIVEALASGDPPEAQRTVEANWHNAAERLARVMDTAGEKGSWRA